MEEKQLYMRVRFVGEHIYYTSMADASCLMSEITVMAKDPEYAVGARWEIELVMLTPSEFEKLPQM